MTAFGPSGFVDRWNIPRLFLKSQLVIFQTCPAHMLPLRLLRPYVLRCQIYLDADPLRFVAIFAPRS